MSEELVGGRYRLAEIIGTGGMGRVWRAEDELLRRTVAVKEVTGAATALVATQTMREARAAARLDHPGVVTVFDVVWQAGRSWIVMEYVESRSLEDALGAAGPFGHAEAARIGLLVLNALRAAHAAGVLHRDVKPQNVLLATDGRVVLTDFGLATMGEREGTREELMGSPQYVAPERIKGLDSTPATDLWSLGATLYTTVEGRPPFDRGNTAASLQAVLAEEPTPPAREGPLTPLILRLLSKDPAERPDPADVAAVLRGASDQRPKRGRAPAPFVPITGTTITSATIAAAVRAKGGPQRISRPGRIAIAGTVVVLLGTGGAALAMDRGPIRVPPPAAISAAAAPESPVAENVGVCGAGNDSRPVTAATTRVPAGLPATWIWTRDPAGFALALPRGWMRAAAGNSICFSDPAGTRAFTVNTSAVVTRQPLTYWQNREKAELAGAELPGYQRISMGVLLLRRGGADWEYRWQPDSDTTQHVRRVLLAVTDNRSYLLQWATTEADWSRNAGVQKQLVNLFGSAT